jgi:hypothetical protein
MDDEPLAYVLSGHDAEWRWRVMDWEGETLAFGVASGQSEAQDSVEAAMRDSRQRSRRPAG